MEKHIDCTDGTIGSVTITTEHKSISHMVTEWYNRKSSSIFAKTLNLDDPIIFAKNEEYKKQRGYFHTK